MTQSYIPSSISIRRGQCSCIVASLTSWPWGLAGPAWQHAYTLPTELRCNWPTELRRTRPTAPRCTWPTELRCNWPIELRSTGPTELRRTRPTELSYTWPNELLWTLTNWATVRRTRPTELRCTWPTELLWTLTNWATPHPTNRATNREFQSFSYCTSRILNFLSVCCQLWPRGSRGRKHLLLLSWPLCLWRTIPGSCCICPPQIKKPATL